MSNPYSQRVNRQLLLARQQLDLLGDAGDAGSRLRRAGLLEAACFHLYRAYLAMLGELASNYQLEFAEPFSRAGDLFQALEQSGKTPGEARELVDLEDQGFIGELLACWRHLFDLPSDSAARQEQAGRPQGLIQIRSLQNWELDGERLHNWLERLTEISDRHRDIMIEY